MCNFFFTAGQTGEHRVELPSKSNEETTQRRLFIVLSVGRTKNGGGGWMGGVTLTPTQRWIQYMQSQSIGSRGGVSISILSRKLHCNQATE